MNTNYTNGLTNILRFIGIILINSYIGIFYVFCAVGFRPEPIVFLVLPRRVRLLVLVCWPLTGKPLICLIP